MQKLVALCEFEANWVNEWNTQAEKSCLGERWGWGKEEGRERGREGEKEEERGEKERDYLNPNMTQAHTFSVNVPITLKKKGWISWPKETSDHKLGNVHQLTALTPLTHGKWLHMGNVTIPQERGFTAHKSSPRRKHPSAK
jgi:hypothetical protein